MNIMGSKRAIFGSIFILIFISSGLGILIKTGIIQGTEYNVNILYIPDEIAWTLTTLFCLYAFMVSDYFDHIYSHKANTKEYFAAIVFASGMSLAATFSIGSINPLLFNSGSIILVLAGLVCGTRIGLIIASVISVAIMLTTYSYMPNESVVYIITLFVIAILTGTVAREGYSGKRNGYIVAFVCFVINAVVVTVAIKSNHYETNTGDWMYVSAIILLVLTLFSIWTFDVFLKMKSDRKAMVRSKEDLRLAHEIQMTAIPHTFPDSHSMDISASMEPAIEVGGDFYDCIQVSRNLTLIVVADVSDKGLPASLLMMRTMGIIRAAAMVKSDPGSVLTTLNKELSNNNPTGQFISVWAGLYDSDTGVLCYSNAGHPAPFLYREGEGFVRLPVKKAPIAGVTDIAKYRTDKIPLRTGDRLFVFTDGVNEAFDKNDRQLGFDGLKRILESSDRSSAASMIESVKAGLRDYVGDIPPADDVTMLCLSVDRSWYHMISVPGKVEELDAVNTFIEDTLSQAGCPEKVTMKMEIVSEEIFVNICDHAYVDTEGSVDVYCGYHDGEVKLTFADTASAFNPINKEDIEIDENVGNWPIGGFGIHMVKNLVTYMDYKNYAGMNIFTVWKKVDDRSSAGSDTDIDEGS